MSARLYRVELATVVYVLATSEADAGRVGLGSARYHDLDAEVRPALLAGVEDGWLDGPPYISRHCDKQDPGTCREILDRERAAQVDPRQQVLPLATPGPATKCKCPAEKQRLSLDGLLCWACMGSVRPGAR